MESPDYQLMRVEEQEGIPVVSVLCSELRSDTVIARLEQELELFIDRSGARQLVLDLSAVHFISSSGLRVLIVLRKRLRTLNGRFTMCGVQPHVSSVFRTTRLFSESFEYLPDTASALAALKGQASPEPGGR